MSIAIFLLLAFSSAFAAVWDGTANTEWYDSEQNSFTISTAEELAGLAQLVNDSNDFKGKTIVLASDIMLNDTTNWKSWDSTTTGLNSWVPIGTTSTPFFGTFDGNGYAIFGIYIYFNGSSSGTFQGLFGAIGDRLGVIGNESIVRNTGVIAFYIKVGGSSTNYTGGVVGINNISVVENCYSNGSVISNGYVGGIVGSNSYSAVVKNSYSVGLVDGSSTDGSTIAIGGVVGRNSGTLDSSYSISTIVGSSRVGGVVGSNSGTASNSYYIGTTELTGHRVGGVAGYNSGTVSNSYSTVDISYSCSDECTGGGGGLVGYNENGSISNCYSTGAVYGNGSFNVGGLVGYDYRGTVLNSYSTGMVYGYVYVGGIVGISAVSVSTVSTTIKNCAALNQSISGSYIIGRIVYENNNNILLSDNRAFRNMSINKTPLVKGHDKEDGEDITADDIISDGTIGGLFTEENGWTIENGKLPGLFGKAVDMPDHITNDLSNAIQNTANATPAIKIWLNGTESFQIQGLSKSEKIRMFNIKGNILLNGMVQPNETISISHLPHGVYFVNVDGKTLRFVK